MKVSIELRQSRHGDSVWLSYQSICDVIQPISIDRLVLRAHRGFGFVVVCQTRPIKSKLKWWGRTPLLFKFTPFSLQFHFACCADAIIDTLNDTCDHTL